MRRGFLWGAILAFLLTTSGCDTATSPLDTINPNRLKSDGLHLVVSTFRTGPDSLTFRHTLQNRGPKDQTLTFGSSQSFDIEVRGLGGELLWQWSYGKAFLDIELDLELAAGESYAGETDWDLKGNDATPLPPGTYRCRFYVTCFPQTGLVSEFTLTL